MNRRAMHKRLCLECCRSCGRRFMRGKADFARLVDEYLAVLPKGAYVAKWRDRD